MRFLHTSDWHLGVSLKHISCQPEQEKFLSWMLDTLREREVEVLVIAGDIFHHSTPSNAARKMYFEFLRGCKDLMGRDDTQKTLRAVVVVAGNHDSASGLEASRELLAADHIYVVGALPRDEQGWADACLVPIKGASGEVELVVAAVPYAPEARLGVSLGEGGDKQLRTRYSDAFTHLYKRLADDARDKWPDAPLVATGHLAVYGDSKDIQADDFHSGLHLSGRPSELIEARFKGADLSSDGPGPVANDGGVHAEPNPIIGTIGVMSPEIFDTRYCYVALGHIHRPMPVAATHRHIRYCGTPVPTSITEAQTGRQVVLVDTEPGITPQDLPIEIVKVPRWRDIFDLRGTHDEIEEMLRTLKSSAPDPAALFIRVRLDPHDTIGVQRLRTYQELLQKHHPSERVPIIIEIREEFAAAEDTQILPQSSLGPVEDLSPMDVFKALFRRRYPKSSGPSSGLISRFAEIENAHQNNDD